jgi:hypothetical protein
MNCIKYTIKSDDIVSGDMSNGMFKVNSQGNQELTKLLNEHKKYKIIVSRFILANGLISGTPVDNAKYIIQVKFNNITLCNSFDGDNVDKVIYRDIADDEEEAHQTRLRDLYVLSNIFSKSNAIYSSDRIIENGLLNIQITYIDPTAGDEITLPFEDDLGRWILEFYISF